MEIDNDEGHLNTLEKICSVGIIGCLLFSTWELNHLMADAWFAKWVALNPFVNRRVILYGVAGLIAVISIFSTIRSSSTKNSFIRTLNVVFLWFGTILLISTIAFFVFDCLPEVFAGVIGSILFIVCIYVLQKKFYSKEKMIKRRVRKGLCYRCGGKIKPNDLYCAECGTEVGKKCPACGSYSLLQDRYCSNCKNRYEQG